MRTDFESSATHAAAAVLARGGLAQMPAAHVVESKAGRIVVAHRDGYRFVFQVHDVDDLHMDLEDVTWSAIGAPPDADDLEQQARAVAEREARARGWIA